MSTQLPTVTATPKSEAEKKLRVQYLLGILIVHVDPARRSVEVFAKRMKVTPQHIYNCVNAGRCSFEFATLLQKEFGPAMAPRDELNWSKVNN